MIVALSNKGSYYIQYRWLEEYNHVFYYDSTERSSDESEATLGEFSLSECNYKSTDDEHDEAAGKSILEQVKE